MDEDFFQQRYAAMCGSRISGFQLQKTIRVNTLKVNDAALLSRLAAKKVRLEKIAFAEHGYRVRASPFSLGSTPEYLSGHYYLQEAAAQMPVQALAPVPGDLVLDMCAAPGGKTTQIAQYMENRGTIVAADINILRLKTLKYALERMGVRNALIYKIDGRRIADLGLEFDRILLDAPCSGNFIIDRKWFGKRDIDGILVKAEVQRSLLQSAVSCLKPGGMLVYSTCSMEPEEDEFVIDWAVNNLDVELEPFTVSGGQDALNGFFGKKMPGMNKCRRFWPHLDKTQGFFLAKLRKI